MFGPTGTSLKETKSSHGTEFENEFWFEVDGEILTKRGVKRRELFTVEFRNPESPVVGTSVRIVE